MPYIGRSTEAFGVRSRFTFLASADDTSVSGNDVNGLPLKFNEFGLAITLWIISLPIPTIYANLL